MLLLPRPDHPVERARRHPGLPVDPGRLHSRLEDDGALLRFAPSRNSGAHETKPSRSPTPLSVSSRCSVSAAPHLFKEDHQPGARLHHLLGNPLVLGGHSLERIDEKHGDVRVRQSLPRPEHGVVVGILCDAGLATDPGGVDHPVRDAVQVDDGVDRVPGRPRRGRHENPLRTGQPVEQGGLPDLGLPTIASEGGVPSTVVSGFSGSVATRASRSSPVPLPVEGAHWARAGRPRGSTGDGRRPPAGLVHLVGHQEDRVSPSLQEPGDPGIVR